MKLRTLGFLSCITLVLILLAGADTGTFAQGKAKGGDKTITNPPTTTTPATPTTKKDMDKTTTATSKSSTTTASTRTAPVNKPPSDKELNKYNGISTKLNVAPTDLRTQYETALAANPNLTFGNFVAANVVASNLSGKNPSITTEAILSGMQSGDSLGQSLQKLGMTSADAKAAEKEAKRQIKDSQKTASQTTPTPKTNQ